MVTKCEFLNSTNMCPEIIKQIDFFKSSWPFGTLEIKLFVFFSSNLFFLSTLFFFGNWTFGRAQKKQVLCLYWPIGETLGGKLWFFRTFRSFQVVGLERNKKISGGFFHPGCFFSGKFPDFEVNIKALGVTTAESSPKFGSEEDWGSVAIFRKCRLVKNGNFR